MKILLFGEYNRSHRFLKDGLLTFGHEVVVAGTDDSFKKVKLDISLEPTFFKRKVWHYLRMSVYRLTRLDLADLEIYFKFNELKPKLSGFDVVQLINEFPLEIHPILEKRCLKFLFSNNKKIILSACGDDTVYVNYLLNNPLEYSIFFDYYKNPTLKKEFKHSLMYTKPSRKKLHDFVFNHIFKVIPQDFDYEMAYRTHNKASKLVPHPINLSNFKFEPLQVSNKLIIFHGINRYNYYKKGNRFFEKALKIINEKHKDNIEVITAENLPYKTYIKALNNAHIILDQALCFDQGYNALEAMAKGKVVFSGAGKDFLTHYNIKENTVVIKAKPDITYLVEQLEFLILNPEKLLEISINARKFVEREHDHIKVAQQFLKTWTT